MIRNIYIHRSLSWFLIWVMLLTIVPTNMYALTGGPSQPEVQSFQPIGVSDMVDVSTGDFSYNIPLLEVGGYPINLVYNAGITMDQQASTVGLGWNINPGVINRTVRGLPDDFKGDKVYSETNLNPNWTVGLNTKLKVEAFGIKVKGLKKIKLTPSLGLFYNNYKGVGFEFGISAALSAGSLFKGSTNVNLGFSLNANSSSGNSFKPNLSFSHVSHKERVNNQKKFRDAKTKFYNKTAKIGYYNSSVSANLSFSDMGYSPSIRYSMRNLSLSANFFFAIPVFGTDGGIDFAGYFVNQKLKNKILNKSAFGMMYSESSIPNGEPNRDAILDFNREKDVPFSKDVTNLPLTQFTNDIYSLSGQGIGGAYQLKRGDVGIIYDNENKNNSNGGSVGFEIGGGQLIRLGGDFHANHGNAKSGHWKMNLFQSFPTTFKNLSFQGRKPSNIGYEPAYFKAVNEASVVDFNEQLYLSTKGEMPLSVKLHDNMSALPTGGFHGGSPIDKQNRKKREKRNQSISYLTALEASTFGLHKKIQNYQLSDDGLNENTSIKTIDRVGNGKEVHHISEITALRPDGLRYVYGIPAYNNSQEKVSFNTDENNTQDCATGLIQYKSGVDNSLNNKNGIDHYYNKTRTPGYAHSFLLTEILSDDYSDLTGNGPSPDDLGSYTKINYHRLNDAYQWRMPYIDAIFNEGYKSDKTDDKGSYTYGTKEIWIIHSIESKTQMAEFHYGERKDGHGVDGAKGGYNSSMDLRKLEKIILYSRPDKYEGGKNRYHPIKTVHFTYDYSRCRNVDTNDGIYDTSDEHVLSNDKGKLTLKEVFFKYGDSQKGKFSPYKFGYSLFNPDYNLKGYNRWGTYQPLDVTHDSWALSNCSLGGALNSTDFPYINQRKRNGLTAKEWADKYASAWNLNKITLPSGADINITYEADDYAYVQEKEAMEMVEIVEMNALPNPITSEPTFGDKLKLFEDNKIPNNYTYFKLKKPIDGNLNPIQVQSLIGNKYIGDIRYNGNLYFKALTKITKDEKDYEYVQGYYDLASSDSYGAVLGNSGNYEYGYIKFRTACTKDREASSNGSCGILKNEANPISKAAWQFVRLNLPKKISGTLGVKGGEDENVMKEALKLLANSFKQIKGFFKGGINNDLRSQGFGDKIIKGKSWIRLYNPEKVKYAGTHRVSKIEITDNWSNMAGGDHENSTYGQEYFYTTESKVGDIIESSTGNVLYDDTHYGSSGVAAYEPLIGGDENPHRLPDKYVKENKLAPDDNHYLEQPYGESFFPAPTIVYSRVKVQNLQHANVKMKATGHTVHEFYTAKDFPTITMKTPAQQVRKRSNPILKVLKISNKDNLTASQGYVITLNDMHGKQKSTSVYNEWGAKISGVSYNYKQNAYGLVNKVKAITKEGIVKGVMLGVDYQMVADARESKTKNIGGGVDFNNDNFLVGFFPIVAIVPLVSISTEKTKYRSIVLTKVIRKQGVLESTTAFDLGSSVRTENLYYDYETGLPLVTKTYNEFEDPIFNFNYPAHWAYKGMQSAYQNIGGERNLVSLGSGWFRVDHTGNPFTYGDELSIDGQKAWVLSIRNNNEIFLVDKYGFETVVIGGGKAKIIRSGHRNQASQPIASVTSLKSPIINDSKVDVSKLSDIINASAIEYDEQRLLSCLNETNNPNEKCICVNSTEFDFYLEVLDFITSQNGISPSNNLSGNNITFSDPSAFGTVLLSIQLNNYLNNKAIKTLDNCPQGQYFADIIYNNNGQVVLDVYVSDPDNNDRICNCPFGLAYDPLLDGKTYSSIAIKGPFTAWNDCESNFASGQLVLGIVGTNNKDSKMVRIGTDCFPALDCKVVRDTTSCPTNIGNIVNPFVLNLRGNYKPNKSYTYLTDRNKSDDPSHDIVNIRKDGTFKEFTPFWKSNSGGLWNKDLNNWTWTSEITKVNQNGNEVESMDPLKRYSSEILGYYNQMVVGVAANARYRQIAFDGFEDYDYDKKMESSIATCPNPKHFWFENGATIVEKDASIAHSGDYYIKLKPLNDVQTTYNLVNPCDANPSFNNSVPYKLAPCDCIGSFQPLPGKYVLGAWVRQGKNPSNGEVSGAVIEIADQSGTLAAFKGSGDIIEGWQRVEGYFELPTTSSEITVRLLNKADRSDVCFDDIRIHPFDASFKSYIYDDVTLRFTNELDENNYFTKYQYSADGSLERVMKETERGVMMIQESRFGQQKN